MAQKKTATAKKSEKDPTLALVLGVLGSLLAIAPGLGHVYWGLTKKGVVYSIIGIVLWGINIGIYIVGSVATAGIGTLLCAPIFLVNIAYNIAVIYDVYKITKGEKPLLPDLLK